MGTIIANIKTLYKAVLVSDNSSILLLTKSILTYFYKKKMGSSHSSHSETVKKEIIQKIEGKFGVNAKVDVDVLVDFLVKVKMSFTNFD